MIPSSLIYDSSHVAYIGATAVDRIASQAPREHNTGNSLASVHVTRKVIDTIKGCKH